MLSMLFLLEGETTRPDWECVSTWDRRNPSGEKGGKATVIFQARNTSMVIITHSIKLPDSKKKQYKALFSRLDRISSVTSRFL